MFVNAVKFSCYHKGKKFGTLHPCPNVSVTKYGNSWPQFSILEKGLQCDKWFAAIGASCI